MKFFFIPREKLAKISLTAHVYKPIRWPILLISDSSVLSSKKVYSEEGKEKKESISLEQIGYLDALPPWGFEKTQWNVTLENVKHGISKPNPGYLW